MSGRVGRQGVAEKGVRFRKPIAARLAHKGELSAVRGAHPIANFARDERGAGDRAEDVSGEPAPSQADLQGPPRGGGGGADANRGPAEGDGRPEAEPGVGAQVACQGAKRSGRNAKGVARELGDDGVPL